MDYCDVCISCLDSYSDGTHSLQSIHCWASDVTLHFSKSDEETNSSTSWMAWGWVHFQQNFFWVNYSFERFDTSGICSLGALVPAGLWVRRSVSRGGWGRDGCWKSHGRRFPNHPDVSSQWVCGKRLLGWTGLLECLMNYTFKNNGSLLALLRTFNTYGNFPLHKRL